MFLVQQLALADSGVLDTKGIDVSISTVWYTFILATLAPLIVGLITKRFVESKTKTILLIFVTVIIQILTELGSTFNLWEFLTKLVMAFILSVGIHYQILKPTGITSVDGFVNNILPDKGIGADYGGNDLLPDPDLIKAENERLGITDEDYPHGV